MPISPSPNGAADYQNVAHRINSRAKAMIVTRSRLHAIRYHRALEWSVTEQGYDYGASSPSPAPSATATRTGRWR